MKMHIKEDAMWFDIWATVNIVLKNTHTEKNVFVTIKPLWRHNPERWEIGGQHCNCTQELLGELTP